MDAHEDKGAYTELIGLGPESKQILLLLQHWTTRPANADTGAHCRGAFLIERDVVKV